MPQCLEPFLAREGDTMLGMREFHSIQRSRKVLETFVGQTQILVFFFLSKMS